MKIILASASPHRKKLLHRLGLAFRVAPSHAKEIMRIKTTCAALVKENALRKAKSASRRFFEGLIIGADTLVYGGGKKIIGKPRTFKEAGRMLQMLCQKPHWVYTGIALIDAKTKKTLVDYEKSKVVMNRLSKKEIEDYHKDIFPLDKAGGFDIQGKGASLIRRIEGCRDNVIGLPVSKLKRMMKKMGVVFSLIILAFLQGCASEYNLATHKEENLMYSSDKEVQMGDAMAQQADKQFKYVTDVDKNERVRKIAQKIFSAADRQDIVYSIKIIDEDTANAFSLPGGYVYLYRGLLDNIENDDQLACVIGHETGHICARHAIKRLQSMYGYEFLKVFSIGVAKSAQLSQGVDLAFGTILMAYSQEDEFQADSLGVKYAKKAGFSPLGMAGFLKKLSKVQEKLGSKPYAYWRTHPFIPQRIAAVNQEVSGSLDFKSYLNLTGEDRINQ